MQYRKPAIRAGVRRHAPVISGGECDVTDLEPDVPTSKELNALVATISERVARYLERQERPARDGR